MTRGRAARAVGAAALLVLAAGCGVQPSAVITGASPPSGNARSGGLGGDLYLVSDRTVVPTTRDVGPLSRVDALALLAEGPTAEERARGLSSEVPRDAAPFTVRDGANGRTVVTLSTSEDPLSPTAVDQIVCTTAIPGTPVSVAGAEPRICPVSG